MVIMVSLTTATISLALQLTALSLLIFAFTLKNKKKYRQHGITNTIAVLFHLTAVLAVMIPSFSTLFTSPGTIVLNTILVISLVHVALGVTSLSLGIWLVGSWHFKTELDRCFANKKIMYPTLALWGTTILLGIVMYIMFWASALLA